MKSNSELKTTEQSLCTMKRRKRKSLLDSKVQNISYNSLFDIYVRECRIKNLSITTIQGYINATRYFLDFSGDDLMCDDISQDLRILYALINYIMW